MAVKNEVKGIRLSISQLNVRHWAVCQRNDGLAAVKCIHHFNKPAGFENDDKQADGCRDRKRAYINDKQNQQSQQALDLDGDPVVVHGNSG